MHVRKPLIQINYAMGIANTSEKLGNVLVVKEVGRKLRDAITVCSANLLSSIVKYLCRLLQSYATFAGMNSAGYVWGNTNGASAQATLVEDGSLALRFLGSLPIARQHSLPCGHHSI